MNRLESVVSAADRPDFLVRRITPGFRETAWIEPFNDDTVSIHMALIRSEPFVRYPATQDQPEQVINMTTVAGEMTIPNIPTDTPRAQLVALAEGHLSDMILTVRNSIQEAQALREAALPRPNPTMPPRPDSNFEIRP